MITTSIPIFSFGSMLIDKCLSLLTCKLGLLQLILPVAAPVCCQQGNILEWDCEMRGSKDWRKESSLLSFLCCRIRPGRGCMGLRDSRTCSEVLFSLCFWVRCRDLLHFLSSCSMSNRISLTCECIYKIGSITISLLTGFLPYFVLLDRQGRIEST